jgi:DNA mismatch repair protein MutS2
MKAEILGNFLRAVEYPELLERLAENCGTPAGRDYLRFLEPLEDLPALRERLSKTRELEGHLLRQRPLTLPDSSRFIEALEKARTEGQVLSAAELSALAAFLGEVARLRRDLSPEGPLPGAFAGWLGRLHALPDLRGSLKSKVSDQGEVNDGASPGLKALRDRLKSLRAGVQDFYRSFLQKQDGAEVLQEKIVTEREGRLVVPIKRDRQYQVPGFVHGMSSSGATLFVEPLEVAEENNRVKETLLAQDEEIRRILREATQEVLASAGLLEEALIACAEVDAHGALARFAAGFDGRYLEPVAGGGLSLKGVRHPLLALEAGKDFRGKVVPLEIEFRGEVRVILVSGPNAGGKTVVLKTLGLCCAMAQAGLPVPAASESFLPWFGHFDCDLEDSQDLGGHLSTYAAKLRALKRMLDHAGPGSLLLLDELGAGTDPREGGALGLACLECLRERGAFVLANTHQPLLKLLTQEEKGMANAAMLFDEATGKPTFRLASGVPGQSHALTLADQMGFPSEVLQKAKAHLPQGEADLSEILAKLGHEREAQERALREAEKSRDAARKLEQELLTARRQMKDEARRIKKEAQAEAEGLLRNTRRKMEHLIQGVQPAGDGVDRERIKSARREVNRKLGNLQAPPAGVLLEVGDLKPGDRVFFKPGNCEVKVAEADEEKGEAVILMPNGTKLACAYGDLGRPAPSHPPPARPSPVLDAGALEGKGRLELDLRGKLVDQALPLLDKFLDDALLVELPFVRIIHGKGTGALKEAVHRHLPAAHPELDFSLAEPSQGGAGVTVIRFKK